MKKTFSSQDRDLRRIMVYGSSFGAGIAAGSLEALRPNLAFDVSFTTFIAFALVTTAFVAYWKLIFAENETPHWKAFRFGATLAVAAFGIAGFLYPMRFVAPEKFPALAGGLGRALVSLLFGAVMLWGCKRFFDADEGSQGCEDRTRAADGL